MDIGASANVFDPMMKYIEIVWTFSLLTGADDEFKEGIKTLLVSVGKTADELRGVLDDVSSVMKPVNNGCKSFVETMKTPINSINTIIDQTTGVASKVSQAMKPLETVTKYGFGTLPEIRFEQKTYRFKFSLGSWPFQKVFNFELTIPYVSINGDLCMELKQFPIIVKGVCGEFCLNALQLAIDSLGIADFLNYMIQALVPIKGLKFKVDVINGKICASMGKQCCGSYTNTNCAKCEVMTAKALGAKLDELDKFIRNYPVIRPLLTSLEAFGKSLIDKLGLKVVDLPDLQNVETGLSPNS